MSDIKIAYGTDGVAITCSLAGLGNGSARESTAVDNSSNLYLDALVQISVKTNAAGTLSTGSVDIYAYGSSDNGTIYAEGATGSDAAITLTSPTNLRRIGTINAVANATTYKSEPMSIAAAFGGSLPKKWGIVVVNNSGAALDATEGNHTKKYQGIYQTAA